MNTALLTSALASLTEATAAYESAWREEVSLAFGSNSRQRTSDAMQDAYRRQVTALEDLTALLGEEQARATHGALIAAAAMVTHERPAHLRNLGAVSDARVFIRQAVSGESGVA